MLEPKSSASGYYISSQNPQVQVFAQLLSSAIVANGQKFKISQPMLEPKSAASAYYVPSVTDGSTRLYLDSKEGFDPANGEDTQQAYLWDGGTLTMRIPVTGVGVDAASSQPYITCGTPLSGGGNPTSIGSYGLGTYVGRRRYCGSQLRRRKPNQRMPLASVDLIGLQKLFDGADGQTFTVNATDVGTTVYNVLAQFTQRWPQLTIAQANFPTVGANYSGSRQNSSVTQMLSDVMSAISSGDLWVIRVGHDRTPRLIKLYTQSTNTYTYNRTLPQGVVEFEPVQVTSDDQDVSNLFNSVMVVGDTDPATKQPVCAIVQDSNSIAAYGQIDAQPVTNTALKTTAACVAYATSLLNQSSLATAQNQFRVYLRNDASATNQPAGLSNGDVVRGIENITISRFSAQGNSLNEMPDSEVLYGPDKNPALWARSDTSVVTGAGLGQSGSNAIAISGSGTASNAYARSGLIDVVPGQTKTVSGYIDATHVSAGSPQIAVYSMIGALLGNPIPGASATQTAGTSGRVSITYSIPSNAMYTQIAVLAMANGATIASGQNLLFSHMQHQAGSQLTAYSVNYAAPDIYGLAASVQTTIDAHGDRWQDVKFAAIEPDWNADMAERANALATAIRANTLTPAAIDQYVVSSDAFPAGGIPTSGLTVNPPTFLALFAAGTAIETISGATFTLPASKTSWAWLNPDKSWTIKQDPSIVAGSILYAYFTTSATAVIGQTPRASVGVVKVGVGNINVASNLPAPTCTGITVANSSTPTTLAADISAALTVTNVPQDGSAYGLAYYFRQTGTSTWVPYGEETFAGLPNPAASIAMPSFIFGQLQNGISYDFAVGFVGLAGYGPLTTIKTALTANSIVVTVPYLIGTTSPTPTVSGVTVTNQISANGLAAAVRLQFTITNQPTDGSLRRISVWFRINGASAWTFYTSQGVPGLPNPSASQAYDITLSDLTNGQNYDFAAAFENAQGQDSATPGIIKTNWAAQAINLPTTALPKIPSGTTVSVSGVTINSYGGASGAAQTVNVTFTPTVTPPVNDNRPFSQWGAGYQYWAKVNDTGASDGDTNVLNYVAVGSNATTTSGSAITDTFGPLGAGHGWQLAIQPMDQQNNGGPLAIVGVTATQTIGTPTLGDFSQAPTVSSNSVTSRTPGVGTKQLFFVTFTETDFGSASPFAKPSNLDHIELVVTVDGNTDSEKYIAIDPSAPLSFTSTSATYKKIVSAPIGSAVSLGVRYVGVNGKPGAVTNLTNGNVADPNGAFVNTADQNGGIAHARSSVSTRGTINATADSDGTYLAHGQVHATHLATGTTGNQISVDTFPDNTFAKIKATEVQGGAGGSGTVMRINDGTNVRTVGVLAAAIGTASEILTTHLSGQTKIINSGTYAGWEQCLSSVVYDSQYYPLSTSVGTDWLWSEWYVLNTASVNSATTGCGPGFKDSAGNRLNCDLYGGSGDVYYTPNGGAATLEGHPSSNPFWNTTATPRPHTIRAGITAASSNQTRFVVYADNIKVLDAIFNVPFIANTPIAPGFEADNPGTQIYLKSYRALSGVQGHEQQSLAVQSALLATANSDGSNVSAGQVTTRTMTAGAATNNKIAGTSVSGTQVFPACYSTQLSNTLYSPNGYIWADSSNAYITAGTLLTNGEVINYNCGSANYGYPPAANPRQTSYNCPANGSVTCVFKHVGFASGGYGVPRVYFTGTTSGGTSNTQQSQGVSGSQNVTWWATGTPPPNTNVHYGQSNGTAQTYSVTTSQGPNASFPIALTLSSVNCPSDADGSSSLTITLKNPSGTTVLNQTGITAAGTWTYAPGTQDAAGQYTWTIQAIASNGNVLGDSPYNSSYTVSFSGTASYWVTTGASGNTYVLAADGSTQRLNALDGNIKFTQVAPDTLAFVVSNSSASNLSFSVGVDVTGV